MANGHEESGSRDRATVALVDAKIDGLKEAVHAESSYTRELITPLLGIPAMLATFRNELRHIKGRVRDLEDEKAGERMAKIETRVEDLEDRAAWRRVNLPVMVFGFVGAVSSILGVAYALH